MLKCFGRYNAVGQMWLQRKYRRRELPSKLERRRRLLPKAT